MANGTSGEARKHKRAAISMWSVYRTRAPSGIPEAFWRGVFVLRIVVACALALAVGSLLAWMITVAVPNCGLPVRPGRLLIAFCAFELGALALFTVGMRVAKRRYEQRLLTSQYRICTVCGYELSGLPTIHVCPECGSAYDYDQSREVLRKWLSDG